MYPCLKGSNRSTSGLPTSCLVESFLLEWKHPFLQSSGGGKVCVGVPNFWNNNTSWQNYFQVAITPKRWEVELWLQIIGTNRKAYMANCPLIFYLRWRRSNSTSLKFWKLISAYLAKSHRKAMWRNLPNQGIKFPLTSLFKFYTFYYKFYNCI